MAWLEDHSTNSYVYYVSEHTVVGSDVDYYIKKMTRTGSDFYSNYKLDQARAHAYYWGYRYDNSDKIFNVENTDVDVYTSNRKVNIFVMHDSDFEEKYGSISSILDTVSNRFEQNSNIKVEFHWYISDQWTPSSGTKYEMNADWEESAGDLLGLVGDWQDNALIYGTESVNHGFDMGLGMTIQNNTKPGVLGWANGNFAIVNGRCNKYDNNHELYHVVQHELTHLFGPYDYKNGYPFYEEESVMRGGDNFDSELIVWFTRGVVW
jgi:hypothetical protein